MAFLEYLEAARGTDDFRRVNIPERLPVEGVRVIGCLQKRTMSIHRAVCILALDNDVTDAELALNEVRRYLHKALGARFWRGLGLGLVVYSEEPLFAKSLFSVVDSVARKTTVFQWVANVSPTVQTLTAALVWKQVTTHHLLDFIAGYMKLDESY